MAKTNDAMNQLVECLSKLLADTFRVYLKTQNFHWNVTGVNFVGLHQLFETQYRELSSSLDEIAERIRGLGRFAPATFDEFTKLSTVQDDRGVQGSTEMIRLLIADHEMIVRALRRMHPVAERARDYASADLVARRMAAHEKMIWMLGAVIEHKRELPMPDELSEDLKVAS